MYSPTLGRFVTADPTGFQAGDVNLYRFVGNSPANATDPSGLAAEQSTVCNQITLGAISVVAGMEPILSIKPEEPRVAAGATIYNWDVHWQLPKVKGLNGYIVQHITATQGGRTKEFTEAWRVIDGEVYVNWIRSDGVNNKIVTGDKSDVDKYSYQSAVGAGAGRVEVRGYARFMAGYEPNPNEWDISAEFGGGAAIVYKNGKSKTIPGWSDLGAIEHHLTITDFGDADKAKITTVPKFAPK